jgi:hypothetical protein
MSANQSNQATKSKATQQPTIFFLLTSLVCPIHLQCQGAANAEDRPCITMAMKRPADAMDTPVNFPKNHDGQKRLGEAVLASIMGRRIEAIPKQQQYECPY